MGACASSSAAELANGSTKTHNGSIRSVINGSGRSANNSSRSANGSGKSILNEDLSLRFSNSTVVPVMGDKEEQFILDSISEHGSTARRPRGTGKSKWKIFVNTSEARKKFVDEGTLPPNSPDSMFEMRLFMEERDLLRSLLNYLSGLGFKVYLLCWAEIESFKSLDPAGFDQQNCSAISICNKFLKLGSVFYLEKAVRDNSLPNYEERIACASELCPLPRNFYSELQLTCIMILYHNVWIHFRTDKLYTDAVNSLKEYNHVDVNDFQYMEKLGEGGFGFVVHGVKLSTRKHYAMKMQSKRKLIGSFSDCPHRVTFERQAMSMCSHPFIVGLDYAFQTAEYVVMAMELGRFGTLLDSLKSCKEQKMSEERVVFYAAEIVLALSHMHRLGFMYRDLKPENVLMMVDGHIKLVDLGGVSDPLDRLLESTNESTDKALQFLNEYAENTVIVEQSKHASKSHPHSPSGKLSPCLPGGRPGSFGGAGKGVRGSGSFISRHTSADSQCEGTPRVRQDVAYLPTLITKKSFIEPPQSVKNMPVDEESSLNIPVQRQSSSLKFGDRMRSSDKSQYNSDILSLVRDTVDVMEGRPRSLRAATIMGTVGYMAPEMLCMYDNDAPVNGYSKAVDWWSLGMMMVELLIGFNPFEKMNVERFLSFYLSDINPPEHGRLLEELRKFEELSSNCHDFLSHLLDTDGAKRLGSGSGGLNDIKKHPLFKGISWTRLGLLSITPPFIPGETEASGMCYADFDDMLRGLNKQTTEDDHHEVTAEEECNFKNWNFVSPNMIKTELGLEYPVAP